MNTAFSRFSSRISPNTLRRIWTICKGWLNISATSITITDFLANLLPDTFTKVRRLLRHEVNFVREQKTLLEAWSLYRSMKGVRVPRLIQPLCSPRITALTEESGIKVTSAAARLPASRRGKVAEQLIEALVAVPLLAAQEDAIFHGDPHAGNLLYDNRTGELTIIDWALRERLSRDQRRHLALLFLMVTLRDPVGTCNEVSGAQRSSIFGTHRRRGGWLRSSSRVFSANCRSRVSLAESMPCCFWNASPCRASSFPGR